MKKCTALAIPILLFAFACATMAAGDQISARPLVFNGDTAMLAIYGEYNQQHKGTLIPVKYTSAWDMKNASMLATAIIVTTYTESGLRKGVIAIQRQAILDGEVVDTHGATAEISVYVFTYNGKEWIFEKGKQKVTEAGTHGVAPDAKLIRTGRDKYGLLFEGGGMGQGESVDYAFIISLDTTPPANVLNLETGGDNKGQSEKGWEWKGKLEFVENRSNDYFVLKVTSRGTKARDDQPEKKERVNKIDYYEYADGKYHLETNKKYGAWKTVDPKVIYSAGEP